MDTTAARSETKAAARPERANAATAVGLFMRACNYAIYLICRFMFRLAAFTPMAWTFFWIRLATRIYWLFPTNRKKIALANLAAAQGLDIPLEDRPRVARESFENVVIGLGEALHMRHRIKKHWREHFTFENTEAVARLVREGKGFFFIGAHFGGWVVLSAILCPFPEIKRLNLVARPFKNPFMESFVRRMADDVFKGNFIATRHMGKTIEQLVADGEVVLFTLDQQARRGQGVFVNFFGRQACSHVAPAHIAWKNNIPMVPFFIIRERPGHFIVRYGDPISYTLDGDGEANNLIVTQAIASALEATIRQYPEQWLWMHERWKRRPEGEEKKI